MKNSYIALAVFSMAAFLVSSCETVNEFQDNTFVPGENDVVFTIGNRIQTKSADADFTTAKVATMDLGKHGNSNFYLDESVISLDGMAAGPMTKGTPAYTENLGILYGNKLGVDASGGLFGTGDVYTLTNADAMVEGGWQYAHKYDSNPWPSSGSVEFYFTMPNDMTNVTITDKSSGAFTFSYESPTKSTDQQDILFGYRTATKAQYEASLPAGLPVLLNHALTGVKFAAGNPDDVTIKSITIDGLYNSGECTITPVSENNYRDVTGNHTSAGAAEWDLSEATTGSFTNDYTQNTGLVEFKTSTTTGEGEDAVTTPGHFANNGNYPDSFAANGGKNNLNDADATQTFWFIPQDFGTANAWRDVTLTVTYSLKGSDTNEEPLEISLGELLAKRGVEWEAGQLYTYTIRIDEVNVKIEDTVTPGTGGAIVGSQKGSVKITNTGNTDVFIRAAIVGQWLDEEDRPVFGFTDKINQLYLVESWYEDQFRNHTGQHGVFVDLPGYINNDEHVSYPNLHNNWFYNSEDGYYYYTKSVAPGMATGQDDEDDDTYDALFTSYTIKAIPHAELAGEYLDAHMYFVLEIATQAISARTDNGSLRPDSDYLDIWSEVRDIDDTPYTPETGEEG